MKKILAAALLASSATLAVVPALAAGTATHDGAHTHHHHHHEHCLNGKCAEGEKSAQSNGDAETADLNAKSLAAAQNNQVPTVAGATSGVGAPTVSAAPTLTAPSVSAPGIPAPVAAGTGVKAPAFPKAPTVPANNGQLPAPVPVQ